MGGECNSRILNSMFRYIFEQGVRVRMDGSAYDREGVIYEWIIIA